MLKEDLEKFKIVSSGFLAFLNSTPVAHPIDIEKKYISLSSEAIQKKSGTTIDEFKSRKSKCAGFYGDLYRN